MSNKTINAVKYLLLLLSLVPYWSYATTIEIVCSSDGSDGRPYDEMIVKIDDVRSELKYQYYSNGIEVHANSLHGVLTIALGGGSVGIRARVQIRPCFSDLPASDCPDASPTYFISFSEEPIRNSIAVRSFIWLEDGTIDGEGKILGLIGNCSTRDY